MELVTSSVIIVVIIVLVFDFTNGFHDAADMVSTAIASRAMSASTAIVTVSIFTFISPFTIGLAVANTVGTFVDINAATPKVGESLVMSAILAAVSFNLLTWKLGYPSSSSNSLAGGLIGSGWYAVGSTNINWGVAALLDGHLDGLMKVLAGLLVSPLLGFVIGFILMKILIRGLRHFTIRIRRLFVISQYVSVSWLGFSHGANDAQKGMAIIGMVLLANGTTSTFTIPVWAIVLCASAITLGTLFGGWKIIKTIGFGLFRIRITHSVANQLGSALVNSIATSIGAPTSTTQVVTATLLGNGAAEKPQHVRWRTAAGIASGWIFNVPISIVLGWCFCYVIVRLWR